MSKQNRDEHAVVIRMLNISDFESWYELWQGYLAFYQTDLPQKTSLATWHNLHNKEQPIYGFGAYIKEAGTEKLIGFTHVVLHPNTWDETDCCYLEDLYVSQSARGLGIGRALIEYVYGFAESKHCNRVYWVTQKDNLAARKLYDSIADLTDMVQYRHNL